MALPLGELSIAIVHSRVMAEYIYSMTVRDCPYLPPRLVNLISQNSAAYPLLLDDTLVRLKFNIIMVVHMRDEDIGDDLQWHSLGITVKAHYEAFRPFSACIYSTLFKIVSFVPEQLG